MSNYNYRLPRFRPRALAFFFRMFETSFETPLKSKGRAAPNKAPTKPPLCKTLRLDSSDGAFATALRLFLYFLSLPSFLAVNGMIPLRAFKAISAMTFTSELGAAFSNFFAALGLALDIISKVSRCFSRWAIFVRKFITSKYNIFYMRCGPNRLI